jgi:hypothetical protein
VALFVCVGFVAAACSSGQQAPVAGAPSTSPSTATSSATGGSTAPELSAEETLASIGLQPEDADDGFTYAGYPGGDQVRGMVSLDICGQRFDSESLRVARHQVGIKGADGKGVISTEALLYRDPAAAEQAMDEIQAAVAACPTTPTKSPVAGAPALSYEVNPPPDGDWQPVEGVDRLAYDLTASDDAGHSARLETIYLRRGRLLLAIYLQRLDQATQAVTGHPSDQDLTDRFATEIAALPDASVE